MFQVGIFNGQTNRVGAGERYTPETIIRKLRDGFDPSILGQNEKATRRWLLSFWLGERDYSGHPALRPFGAVSLRSTFKFVPDKFVEPRRLWRQRYCIGLSANQIRQTRHEGGFVVSGCGSSLAGTSLCLNSLFEWENTGKCKGTNQSYSLNSARIGLQPTHPGGTMANNLGP